MNSLSYLSRQYDVLASPSPKHLDRKLGKRRKDHRFQQRFLMTKLADSLWTWVHARWVVWMFMRRALAGQDWDDDTAVEDEGDGNEDDQRLQGIKEDDTEDGEEEKPRPAISKPSRAKKGGRIEALKIDENPAFSAQPASNTDSGIFINPRSSVDDLPTSPSFASSSLELPKLDLTPPTPQSVPLPLPQTLRLNPSATSLLTTHPQSKSNNAQYQYQLSSYQSSPSSSRPLTPRPQQNPSSMLLPMTLVLDLDETLIHSTSKLPQGYNSQGQGLFSAGGLGFGMMGLGSGMWGGKKKALGPAHMVEVVLGGRSTLYHVYKRPFVDYFLRKVSSWYTVVIFTASLQEYADPVIDWLDAGRGILGRRLFRESCTQLPNGTYSKDLTIIESDLSRVALLDNSPISYCNFPANGIPIEGWISDPSDEALLDLLPVLDSLRFTTDVRKVLGLRGFGCS